MQNKTKEDEIENEAMTNSAYAASIERWPVNTPANASAFHNMRCEFGLGYERGWQAHAKYSTVASPSMQWVKASERLPDNEWGRFCKIGAMMALCFYTKSENIWTDETGVKYKSDKIEWLDEAAPIIKESEECNERGIWEEMLIIYHSLSKMEENTLNWNINILMENYQLSKRSPTLSIKDGKEDDRIPNYNSPEYLEKIKALSGTAPVGSDLKQKFAEHLGVPELETSDAYAIEWAVKNLNV